MPQFDGATFFMKEIIITSPKYGVHKALVDDEDYELVSKYRWTIEKGRTTFYAIHSSGWYWYKGKTIKKGVTFRMHQLILGVEPIKDGKRAKPIDHKDHNGLNNQKSNIKVVTNSNNGANSRITKTNNSTGYKGVTIKKGNKKKYCARIRVNDKLIHLGMYQTAIEAAVAYNEGALKYFGEFAWLNPIPNV